MFESWKKNETLLEEIIKIGEEALIVISKSSLDKKTKDLITVKIHVDIITLSKNLAAVKEGKFYQYFIDILEGFEGFVFLNPEAFSFTLTLSENERKELLALVASARVHARELLKRVPKVA